MRPSLKKNHMKLSIIAAVSLFATAMPSLLMAQQSNDVQAAKFLLGPLGFTPRLALKDFGVDTNPLNASANPERDVTATLVSGVDSWLRLGRGTVFSKSYSEYMYFNNSPTQRSVNANQQLRAEVSLNRVTPYVTGAYLRTRQRPNLEIDTRVQQNTNSLGVGTGLRVGGRLKFDLEGRRTSTAFGNGRYGDLAIAQALDRRSDVYAVSTKVMLTPLTSFVVRAERLRDRFEASRQRDSDSISLLPGFEIKPSALVSGKLFLGYQRFNAVDARVPDYGGIVAEVDAHYMWRESTRIAFKANRNVQYSIEQEQPYFVGTGGSVEVTHILGNEWFAVSRVGRTRLAYRNLFSADASTVRAAQRSDYIGMYGVGFGRLLGDDVRVGFDVNHVNRTSMLRTHQYDGFRYGLTISYGS